MGGWVGSLSRDVVCVFPPSLQNFRQQGNKSKFISEERILRKKVYGPRLSGVGEQQRRRPACASAQSDQRLCHSLFEKYHM